MSSPQTGEPVRYSTDIKPLFRESDRSSMSFAFDLFSYDDVKDYADEILQRLSGGTMPCDGPWPREHVDLFATWVRTGKQP